MMASQPDLKTDAIADAGQRAGVYQLLARLWAKELDADMLAALQSGPLGEAYSGVGGCVPNAPVKPDTMESLNLDFCRLFIGPKGHIPAVQSVFQEGRFEGDAVASMRQVMEIVGIECLLFESLPSDHVANLLSTFAVLLSAAETEVASRDDLANLSAAVFASHLEWIAKLAVIAASRAQTKFYSHMLLVTEEFLAEEKRLFQVFQSGI